MLTNQPQFSSGQITDTDRLITKAVAARLLSVSTRTLDRLCSKDLIQKLHVGGSVRFRMSDVQKIIQQGV